MARVDICIGVLSIWEGRMDWVPSIGDRISINRSMQEKAMKAGALFWGKKGEIPEPGTVVERTVWFPVHGPDRGESVWRLRIVKQEADPWAS